MPDLKKVLAGLECCVLRDPDDKPRCSECAYDGNCVNRLKMDAHTLLRHQNEKIISLKRERAILKEKTQVVHCKDCAFWTPYNAEESDTSGRCQSRYGVCEGQTTDMMWYCADGMKEET